MQQLNINPELQRLIPPLTQEEFSQLTANVLAEGIREPIITWNGTIVDGHNRYQVAQEYDLEFDTSEMYFKSLDDCKEWMILNQFGRRNLNGYQRVDLVLKLENIYAAKAKEQQKRKPDFVPQKSEEQNPIETNKELAKLANVSHDTVAKVKVIQANASEEVKEQLRSGEVSINQAYKDIKKEQKEKAKTEKAEQIKSQEFALIENIRHGDCISHIQELDEESIDCVITDPPYGVDFQMNAYNNELSRKIENDQSIEKALELLSQVLTELKPKIKKDGQLYIFCSWQIYPAFHQVVTKHFEIHNLLIWNKMVMGMGDLKSNFGGMYEMIIFAGNKREFTTRPPNIFNIRFNDERFHNTQKPVELIKTIIKISTKQGEFVYDPFLGSGTTAIAAKMSGRSFGGAEIDGQNYKITLKRLSDAGI